MWSLIRRALGHEAPVSPWDNDELLRASCSASNGSNSMPSAWPAHSKSRRNRYVARRSAPAERQRIGAADAPIARSPGRWAKSRDITPAAEWLLDNYHLIEAQIADVREDLPPRFYRQLPRLAGGPLAATRGCSASPGRLSRTPTVASSRMPCAGSCRPTSECSR